MPDLSQSCRRTSSRKDVPEMIFKDGDFNKPLDPLQSFDWVLLQKEKLSEGRREGGGWSSIASMNSRRLLHVSPSAEVDMILAAQFKHY